MGIESAGTASGERRFSCLERAAAFFIAQKNDAGVLAQRAGGGTVCLASPARGIGGVGGGAQGCVEHIFLDADVVGVGEIRAGRKNIEHPTSNIQQSMVLLVGGILFRAGADGETDGRDAAIRAVAAGLLAVKTIHDSRFTQYSSNPTIQQSTNPFAFEKLPFFGLAVVSSVVTFFVQKSSGAVSSLVQAPLPVRLENAAVSYVAYLAKMFWPANLALIYPYHPDIGSGKLTFAVLLLAGVTALVLVLARQFRFLATGWGWYLVTLLPVIGLVQVGSQAMADRYTYLPLIGLFIALVWGGALLVETLRQMQIPAVIVAVGLLAACATVTARQLQYWTDTRTLCEHTLRVTSDNAVAQFILANVLMEQGATTEAVEHYHEAIRLNPDYPDSRLNLAVALQRAGKTDEAMTELQGLLQADPSLAKAHDKLAILLWQQGQTASAIAQFQEALRVGPRFRRGRQQPRLVARHLSRPGVSGRSGSRSSGRTGRATIRKDGRCPASWTRWLPLWRKQEGLKKPCKPRTGRGNWHWPKINPNWRGKSPNDRGFIAGISPIVPVPN